MKFATFIHAGSGEACYINPHQVTGVSRARDKDNPALELSGVMLSSGQLIPVVGPPDRTAARLEFTASGELELDTQGPVS
jgi:hypothetical protein